MSGAQAASPQPVTLFLKPLFALTTLGAQLQVSVSLPPPPPRPDVRN